ncbi:MAG: class I SAM-dependent methyltransferase [Candidatus Omnitrophica bacterium]|nr:class I SAM-dependent methyltransferase [Candidatus Omnitrophota bacterium]
MRYKPTLTEEAIADNHKYFKERVTLYKDLGIDFSDIRSSILEKAGPLKGTILEIGSGSGHTTLALAKAGYKFISIDLDEDALRKTALNLAYERLFSKVDLYFMNGKSMEFRDGSFQNVIAVNLFHHIEGVDDMLSEIDRVLSRDGKAVLADFNKEGMKIINSVHHREGRVHEDSGTTKRHIYSYFSKLGYKITQPEDQYHWILIAEKIIRS